MKFAVQVRYYSRTLQPELVAFNNNMKGVGVEGFILNEPA